MRAAIVLFLAGAFLAVTAMSTARADDTIYYTVSGKVLAKSTGNPVSGAQVTIGTKTMVSDDAGFYRMDLLPGDYAIEVSAPGYSKYVGNISLYSNMSRDFELKTAPAPGPCDVVWMALAMPLATIALAGWRKRASS